MDEFKSKILRILSGIEDVPPYIMAVEVANISNKLLEDKLAEQGKVLSERDEEEFAKKIAPLLNAKELPELDKALSEFEQFAQGLSGLKSGELESAIALEMRPTIRQISELRKISEEKKEGKILPFKPEGGKH